MKDELSVQELTSRAQDYLKRTYNEDTVRMDVLDNGVRDGTGTLHVDCTVSVQGARSDWTKWFEFRNGAVVNLRARMR